MTDPAGPTVELGLEQRLALRQAAERLRDRFAGQLNVETIERFLMDSYDQISEGARLPDWLPLLAERFARERLRALVRLEAGVEVTTPAVLFLCVHNAGRSQMAAGWMHHLAGDQVDVFSGGSEPADAVNRGAVAAMAEVGIDISGELPQPWADEIVRAADVVVTMGCGDACPLYPGKRYVDWELDDPAGKSLDEIRPIRDEIERRVRTLMRELALEPLRS
jgi:protein-tyrosine-phosphatase